MDTPLNTDSVAFSAFAVPVPKVAEKKAVLSSRLEPSRVVHPLKDVDLLKESFDDTYEDLQNLANWLLRSEKNALTLQSDDLVHEAFLRLTRSTTNLRWENRRQLINLIVETMRRILIDHARRKSTLRSGGAHAQVSWDDALNECASEESTEDSYLIDLNEAIAQLATIHKAAAEVVNLRFFAGLTFDEISSVLEKPRSTIYREWLAARAWLKTELTRSKDT